MGHTQESGTDALPNYGKQTEKLSKLATTQFMAELLQDVDGHATSMMKETLHTTLTGGEVAKQTISEAQRKQLRSAFDLFDTDGSGKKHQSIYAV